MSGKFAGYILVSDMDGTLLDDEKKVSRANIDAINYFKSEDGLFCVASGRNPESLSRYFGQFTVNAPCIALNGAIVYDFDKDAILSRSNLDQGQAAAITQAVMDNFPGVGVEIYADNSLYVAQANAYTARHVNIESLTFHDRALSEIRDKWLKVILTDRPENLKPVERFIQDGPLLRDNPDCICMFTEDVFYEIMDKQTSKGFALSEMRKMDALRGRTAVAVGDSYNDLHMLRESDFALAVSNAREEVKEIADMVICSNNESAIAKAVEYIDSGRIRI